MIEYARKVPSGRTHHIVRGDATLCGVSVRRTGWAVWDAAMNKRVDPMPMCRKCETFARFPLGRIVPVPAHGAQELMMAHTVAIVETTVLGINAYRAECSCGWACTHQPHDREATAVAHGTRHLSAS